MELVVEAGAAVTMTRRGVVKEALIVVEGDRIVDVGPRRELARKYRGYDRLDASNCVVTPGLVNAHTHAAMTLLRGYADDLPLRPWLEQKIWPLEAVMDDRSIYVGALLACVESALMGVTCLNTMYHFKPELNEAKAIAEAGLRGFVGHVCFTWRREEDLKASKELVAKWHGARGGRVRATIDPHAPYTVDPDYLMELCRLAQELSEKTGLPIPVHIHLAETEDEALKVKEAFNVDVGEGVVAYLDRLGVLGPWLVAAHCVWLSDREVELLVERGVKVVHCPVSNLKLGAGIAPIPKLLSKGATIALGTDSACSNNVLDLLETAKLAALLHKGIGRDPTLIRAEDALKMATVNGAAALEVGCYGLVEGGEADFMLLDASASTFNPVPSPLSIISHLVYAGESLRPRFLVVGGRLVLRDGVFTRVDERRVVEEASRAAESLLKPS